MQTINCNGRIMEFSSPKIMGILNITPDSFYDGGFYSDVKSALTHAKDMIDQGVDIIDIGGISSRPGAKLLDPETEIKRVLPVLRKIREIFPDLFISIDTFRSEVARKCIDNGADIINDISAGELDHAMIDFIAESKTPYCMMHMKDNPETMQNNTNYSDITRHILQFFIKKVDQCLKMGIKDMIIDPGFGFGKSLEGNYEILNKLEVFSILDLPVLVGISRKSMIYKTLGSSPEEALFGTAAAHMVALQKSASILRVHDVKAAAEVIKIWEKTENPQL